MSEVIDIGDPEAVAERNQKIRLNQRSEAEEFRDLMDNPAFRAFAWRMLEEAQCFATTMTGNSWTFHNEGKRHMGLWLLGQINTIHPESYVIMLREANARKSRKGELNMSDQPSEAVQSTDTAEAPVEQTSLLGQAPSDTAVTETEAKPETEGEAPKEDAPAPIEYTDFTMPEGTAVDEAVLTAAKEQFQKDGLSQERAQAYVDLYTSKMKEAADAPYRAWAETQKAWQDAVKSDAEIGGPKLAESLGIAAKAVERFGGKDLQEALYYTGAGNNPAVIKAFIKIGKAISEDALVLGRGTTQQDNRTRGQRLYPTDPLRPSQEQ